MLSSPTSGRRTLGRLTTFGIYLVTRVVNSGEEF